MQNLYRTVKRKPYIPFKKKEKSNRDKDMPTREEVYGNLDSGDEWKEEHEL